MKFLKIVFIVFLVLFAFLGLLTFGGIYHVIRHDKIGDETAEQMILPVISDWNMERLTEHLDAHAVIRVTGDVLETKTLFEGFGGDTKLVKQVFDYARNTYGKMESYKSSGCAGSYVVASCSVVAEFEHGKASIMFSFHKEDDVIKITRFYIRDWGVSGKVSNPIEHTIPVQR